MWRFIFVWKIFLVLSLCIGCTNRKSDVQVVSNQIIIKFKAETRPATADSLAQRLGLSLVNEIPQLGARVYEIPANTTIEKVIKKCQQNSLVEYAEPNYAVRALDKQIRE